MRWLHRVVSVGSCVGLSLVGPFGDGNLCRAQQGMNNNGVPRFNVPGIRGLAAGPVRGVAPPIAGNMDLSSAFHTQNLPFIFNPAATTANRYPMPPGTPYNPLVMAPTTAGPAATNPFQPPYSPFGVNLFHGSNPFSPPPLNPFVLSGLYSPLYNPYLNNPVLMAQLNSLVLGQLGMYPVDPLSGGGVPVGNFVNRNLGMNPGVPNMGAGLNLGNGNNVVNPGAGN